MTNQNSPAVFNFNNSTQIRMFTDENQNPWFLASDVCEVLGYSNPRKAVLDHCKEHGVTKRYAIDKINRKQQSTYINEGNLYRLIVKSKKPEAEKFEVWVMEEVLPTIRKTGQYQKSDENLEKLTNKDMENLTYLVKVMSNGFRFKDSASAGIWFALRAVTRTPSPQKFNMQDLPILAEECKRIMAISSAYNKAVSSAEKTLLRKVVRGNSSAEQIINDMSNQIESIAQSREIDFSSIDKFENRLLSEFALRN